MRKQDTRGERVIRFIERYCLVPSGEHVSRPMVLAEFQKRFIREVYDNPAGTRRAYLSIARKNGKSGLIAGLLLAHLAGPEAKLNSQIVSGAMSREQAAIVFDLAAKMVQLSPELSKVVRIVPSGKRLIGLARNVEYKALAAEGKTAHGLSPVLAILDEVGQVRGPRDDFIDAIVTSQGAHAEPILLAISTQAPNDADLLSVWLDDAKTSNDPRIVSHVYAAPADCDLLDEEAWRAANPALGLFRSEDDLREQMVQASRMPSAENTARNLLLNQRVELVAPFVSSAVWSRCAAEPDDEAFREGPVFGGIDLSARTDLTALVLVAWRDGRWHVRPHFWTPEKGLAERSKRDRAPYDMWHAQGLIRTSPGASIDYENVARDMAEILSDYDVQAIAFDRWRFDVLKKELDELGVEFPLAPFGQGFKDMGPALEALEAAFLNEQLAHGDNPVLRMCAANARVERDAAGNRKLSKSKATGRIDGMVALSMAMGVAVSAQAEPQPEYEIHFI